MTKFNPKKPYGTIRGKLEGFPNAKYAQNGLIFDGARICLNPENAKVPDPVDPVADATENLREKLQAKADKALIALEKAKATLEDKPSAANQGKYTKAINAYDKAQAELDKLAE